MIALKTMTGWRGLKFPFQFENGKPAVSSATVEENNYTHIDESIKQILGTFYNERPFSNRAGDNASMQIGLKQRLMFRSFSNELIPYYERIIREVLEDNERRVNFLDITIDPTSTNSGQILISIGWQLINSNIPHLTEVALTEK